jgi:5-methylcytosine-specific restriction endonuclease McrA
MSSPTTLAIDRSILVLNASYEPLNVCSWRRAIVLVLKKKAQILSEQVIRLLTYVRLPIRRINAKKPSRSLILKRDGFTCQYCGSDRDLTIDHVLPQSRGGGDTWENMVACCYTCNNVKDDRTPEEWGVPLNRRPHTPFSRFLLTLNSSIVPEWKEYLFT